MSVDPDMPVEKTDTVDPYRPPSSGLQEEQRPPGSPIKAIGIGFVVDYAGTFLIGFVLAFFFIISAASRDMNPEALEEALNNFDPLSPLALFSYLAGGSMSVLGGYVCARIARRSEYRYGLILAILVIVAGFFLEDESDPVLLNLFLNFLTLIAVFLGTYLGIRRNTRFTRER